MADDAEDVFRRYGYGDPRWLSPDDVKARAPDPNWNRFQLPPKEPRAELRNPAPRPDAYVDERTRDYVAGPGPFALTGLAAAYGMGRTAGQAGVDLSRGNYSDATLNLLEVLAGTLPLPGAKGKAHEPVRKGAGERPGQGAEARGVSHEGRVGDSGPELPASGRPIDPYAPVPGQPRTVKIPGYGEIEARPIPQVEAAHREYAEKNGLPAGRPMELPKLDPERARRIAAAFDAMEHNPTDPAVRRAYDAMIEETLAQYRMLDNKGSSFGSMKAG